MEALNETLLDVDGDKFFCNTSDSDQNYDYKITLQLFTLHTFWNTTEKAFRTHSLEHKPTPTP